MPERNSIAVVVSHLLSDCHGTLANILVRDIRDGLDLLLKPWRLQAT
jgi:hypothetical protein